MISNRISLLRSQKGFTQQKLADAVGIERTALSNIENCKYSPSAKTMMAISDALKEPIGAIFFNPDV